MVNYAPSRVGKISELTDIPLRWCWGAIAKYAPRNVENQNMNPLDNMRADMFVRWWSPTGWPRGQNQNFWGGNSSGLVQGERYKGERRTRMPLLLDFGSNSSQMTGSRACWPQRRIPDILPSDSEVLVCLQRADGLLTICVAGGGVRERADNLLISLFLSHFQTLCGLNSVESLCESM